MMKPCIWTTMAPQEDLPGALRYLHERGWRWFELSDEHLRWLHAGAGGDGIDEVRALLDQLGVTMPQAHALLSADVMRGNHEVDRLAADIDMCAAIGVRNVVMHPGVGSGFGTSAEHEEQLRVNVDAFRRLSDRAADRDVRLAIENLSDQFAGPGRSMIASTVQSMLELLGAIDRANVGTTLDTSHANMQELEIPAAIRAWGSRLFATHISDNDGSADQHLIPGVARGRVIDWPAVVQALNAIGYDGVFNLEIPGARARCPALLDASTRHALVVAERLVAMT